MKIFVVVQLLCYIRLFVTPWTAAHQASLTFMIHVVKGYDFYWLNWLFQELKVFPLHANSWLTGYTASLSGPNRTRWLRQWRIHPQCRRSGFSPWVGEIPWRREWLPTPVFLPGESQEQRTLATVHGVAKSQTWLSN